MTRSRWTIPLILAVTVFVHYLDRNNLAIVLPQVAREFGWDNRQIGQYGNLLLGAFYVTFGVAQVILSPLAERWGVKRSLMASVVGFSVCTMLFYPLGGSLGALIALRLLLGRGGERAYADEQRAGRAVVRARTSAGGRTQFMWRASWSRWRSRR
jgi:MFS family permease